MINSDISFLGVSLLVVLLMASIVIYWLIDRKEMMRVLKVFGLMAGQMAVVGVIIWTVYKANAWWANLLWLVVLIALATGWCLLKMRKTWKQMLMPIIAALTAGTLIGSGVMMLCLSGRFFIPVTAVVVAHLVVAVKDTLQTYQRSLMHTEAHRQYMQANGASLLESLMPSVRRALRATVQPQLRTMAQPLLVTMPLLFVGMLLGGISPATAVFVMILLMMAAFVSTVVAAIVALYCFKR
jgi:putative ABC transport system permease protein